MFDRALGKIVKSALKVKQIFDPCNQYLVNFGEKSLNFLLPLFRWVKTCFPDGRSLNDKAIIETFIKRRSSTML